MTTIHHINCGTLVVPSYPKGHQAAEGRNRAENRMTSVLMGPGGDFKAKAFDLVVAMAS